MTSDFYENEQINEQEKQIGSKQAFTRLLPSLKEHKKALWTCLILLAAATIISLYWPILLRHALDVDIVNADFKGLIVTVVAIGMIQVISIALQYVMRVKLEIIGQDVMLTLKRKLFNHILSLDVDYFDKNPVGRLIARVESDT
ncbi:MAG: ABC transporter transmembrane domain-containing protein, partial [Candidatus Zixiibacteriota bacterium]